MPGRRGRAWGNALGGYRKQPRVGGRFASKGTAGARISNKSRNRKIRGKIYRGTAIAAGASAVVGAGYYAHKSGFDKKLVKAPSVRATAKYAKSAGGVLGKSVLNTRITQVGPNRYTIQKSIDTSKELHKALTATRKIHKRARYIGAARKADKVRWQKSSELHKLLAKAESRSSGVSAKRNPTKPWKAPSIPTRAALAAQWDSYVRSPTYIKKWVAEQNKNLRR